MKKPIRLKNKAVQDVEAALDYLLREGSENASMGLIEALRKTYKHIQSHPTSGSSRFAHELDLPAIRSWPTQRFPYIVFYVEQEQHIEIWRVLHTHRDIPALLSPPTTPH